MKLKPIYLQMIIAVFAAIILQCETGMDMIDSNNKTYEDSGVKIDFSNGGYAEYRLDNNNPFNENNYFSTYIKIIEFCPTINLPSHMQQVQSKSGWLCKLYILPGTSKDNAIDSIKNCHKFHKHSYQSETEEIVIKNKQILKWRYEIGKTRLDHYLVFGIKDNYLFISSPYGEHGEIVSLIENLILK